MSEIFERAARALYENCDDSDHEDWDEMGESLREPWRRGARAVLEAIREPTEDMLIACHKAVVFEQDTPEYVGWRAMIDELLREG